MEWEVNIARHSLDPHSCTPCAIVADAVPRTAITCPGRRNRAARDGDNVQCDVLTCPGLR
eukprot:3939558-Rhodomonas_salina.3